MNATKRLTRTELEAMTVTALRRLCRQRGWDFRYLGELKKAELIEKMLKQQADHA